MYFWLFAFFLKVTLRNSILSWKLWWLHRTRACVPRWKGRYACWGMGMLSGF